MDKATKNKIKSMVLNLREEFEEEIEICLRRYGIYVDKEWKHPNALTHLSQEDREKRKKVAAFIKRTKESEEDAVREFIREAAYTWINRLIGLKCMETRGLIEEVITIRPEYENRSRRHRDFRYNNPDKASKEDDGLIPCLFEVFSEINEEIGVLFDPENEYSLVIPRYPFLKKVIQTINTELDYDVYRQDELLGWVYQYFQTKEKDRIFEEVSTKKKKISGSDIIPVTSLYTEKYMVKFLVENSLGALWQEMYPDSSLKESWEYFVEDPNNSTRDPKPVKEITFLDPACGSGHFLLYAFDIFYQMYKEEAQNNPDWAVPEEKIPEYILRYNLHGIDIDLRSIQLSALGLYMKAKQMNPDIKIETMNLVAANAVMMNKEILEDFLEEFKGDPTAQKVIKTLWGGLENLRELGSLLKIEEQIDNVIKEAKSQTTLTASTSSEFSWSGWKQNILEALKRYYEKAVGEEGDVNKQLFAREAEKGLNFIDLISQKYDVVATNPPYMYNRNMGEILRKNIRIYYQKSCLDVYTSFIDRCSQIVKVNGFISMITQQSFMFLSTYEELRKKILTDFSIRNVAHLGPHAFRDIGGEKVNTTMFSFRKKCFDDFKCVFFRLTKNNEKALKLKDIISGNSEKDVYILLQKSLKIIDGWPFAYWVSDGILSLFQGNKTIEEIIEIPNRTKTSDNDKYLRYHWECDTNIKTNGEKWVLYTKGGGYSRWYGNLEFLVNWGEKARKFFREDPNGRITDEKFWFREGITYTDLASKGFNARYLPPICVYDVSGPALLPKSPDNNLFILGLLNSSLFTYLLQLLNPTMHFQTGDIIRIPIKRDSNREKIIIDFAEQCVSLKKSLLQFNINDREFKRPVILRQDGFMKNLKQSVGKKIIREGYFNYLNHNEEQLIKLHTYESMIDDEIFKLYKINKEDQEQILKEQGTPASFHPIIEGFEVIPDDMLEEGKEYLRNLERIQIPQERLDEIGEKLISLYEKGNSIEDISVELEINPVSVVAMRRELGIINNKDLKHEVENLLTYFIFEELKKDEDGIIPLSKDTYESTMTDRILKNIEEMFGEDKVTEILSEIKQILGKDLEKWLSTDFFNKHISQFKKRPIVWHFKSDKNSFEGFVYYHKLNNQTLYILRNKYVQKALEINKSRLWEKQEELKNSGEKGKGSLSKEVEQLEYLVDDLENYIKALDQVIAINYDPVIDDGVLANISPIQKAGLLSKNVLTKKQLDKGLKLLKEYIEERKQTQEAV